MVDIDGPNMRLVGTQTHRLACNWKLMVDAFLEVYHIRTVHPDNAALLYDDQSVTVAMLPNGHSRLTVDKRDELRDMPMVSPELDNPSVPQLWRQTSTSFGIFPNLVVPMDTGAFTFLCMWPIDVVTTELELRWYAPAWDGDEVPAEHQMRMALFDTVMAQDTANMAPIQASVVVTGRPAVPDRLARAADPPLPAGRRPGDRRRTACRRARRCPTPSTASWSRSDIAIAAAPPSPAPGGRVAMRHGRRHVAARAGPGTGRPPTPTAADAVVLGEELVGRWAHYDVVAYEEAPMKTLIVSYGFTDFAVDDGELVESDSFCHADQVSNQAIETSISDEATRAIVPVSTPVEVSEVDGVLRVQRPATPTPVGIRLDDPANDPLPSDPADPRIVDDDEDGNPGITVHVKGGGDFEGDLFLARPRDIRLRPDRGRSRSPDRHGGR